MNYAMKSPEETAELAEKCDSVSIPPLDPLYGLDGPLPRVWKEAVKNAVSGRIRARM
jgi:hypothetical protein